MKKIVNSFFTVLCLFNCGHLSAYTINGRVAGYSGKWNNKIYLAAIRSINDFQSASEKMIINVTDIDSTGNFLISGSNLPEENRFYRIYFVNRPDGGMQFITGFKQNFIHLMMSNNSKISINIDFSEGPIYQAKVLGSENSSFLLGFYKNIYYLSEQNFQNPYTQVNLNDQKYFDLIKNTIIQNRNPYYTIFALSHLNWEEHFKTDFSFFESSVNELNNQLPNNLYVKQLLTKFQLLDFQYSPIKEFLNIGTFTFLGAIIIFLLFSVFFLIFQYRRLKIRTPQPNVQRLSKKELEVALHLVSGKSNKEISNLLFIEVSTVKTHVNSIYQKMQVTNRTELGLKLKV